MRATLAAGLLVSPPRSRCLTRLPVHGHYFWDLFPAFVLGGAGMGFSFVPVTIASLSGVERADAGVASGLDQHEPPDRRRDRHRGREHDRRHLDGQLRRTHAGVTASSGVALDHGFQTALYVLTGLLVAGAVIAIAFVQSAPRPGAVAEGVEGDALVLEKAA